MSTKPTTVEELKRKFPTYERDRQRHLISIIKECLDWRIANTGKTPKNFCARPEVIQKYMSYIQTSRDIAGVRGNICDLFLTMKPHTAFHQYYQYDQLSKIFKNQLDFNPLESVLEEQKELPSTVMESNDKTGDFIVEYGTRHVFKAPIVNESHYFECVKVFNEMCRSYS
jgi:hypothetical protein|tara:strand:+ start:191 stop:700 length:510 start_codon:yes stop_codon:yes gene_type:complete